MRIPIYDIITGEYRSLWRFEWWLWWFPHENYDPKNHGRIHLFGKLYFRVKNADDEKR